MRGSIVTMAMLALLDFTVGTANEWTPPDSFWEGMYVGSPESWNGLYLNLSDPAVSVDIEALSLGQQRVAPDQSLVVTIPFLIRFGWQAFNLALTGAGLAGTIKGCKQTKGKANNIFYCVTGLVSTVIGIGSAAAAAKKYATAQGFFAKASNTWSNSGLENIALDIFTGAPVHPPPPGLQHPAKRGYNGPDEEMAQKAHNHFVYSAIRSLSDAEVEFLGYAPEDHRLAKRESEVHPFAPVFRFTHAKYGAIDLVSRDLGDEGMHFTIAYADHPTHVRRDVYFQHERLNSHFMEARFDEAASKADPAQISFDASQGFDQIEKTLSCFTGETWKSGNVLSAQLYDKTHKATFAFASVGIFDDDSVDKSFQSFKAKGMPLTGGANC